VDAPASVTSTFREFIDMTNETPPAGAASTVTFVDNPLAPDVYADDAVGFLFHNGIVKVTLVSARVNPVTIPGPIHRVSVGRLIMPVAGAQALAVGLFNFLKSHGLAPSMDGKPN
jgi:hypothetical protein